MFCGARGIPLYGPSGASAHLRGVARALQRRRRRRAGGHRARRGCPRPLGRRRAAPRGPRRAVGAAAPAHGGARASGHRLAARAWARGRPALLWERHEPATRAAGQWARLTGTPRVVELNAPLAWERRWPAAPRVGALQREAASLRAADRVVAVSAWLADWAVHAAGCAPERVVHVPNGVAPQGLGDRERARATLGLQGDVLGFLGSMRRWRGAARLPALLDALGPGWTALCVGPGAPDHPRIVAVGGCTSGALPDLCAAIGRGDRALHGRGAALAVSAQGAAVPRPGRPRRRDRRGRRADADRRRGRAPARHRRPGRLGRGGAAAARPAAGPRVRPWDDVVREALLGLS
ncbi:MAG: glycosyltransferase [Myxococcota bacterium]